MTDDPEQPYGEAEDPAVVACIDSLLADHSRQGELTWDDFDRAVDRRGLTHSQADLVWGAVADAVGAARGVDIRVDLPGPLAVSVGFELPSHRVLTGPEEQTLGRRIRLAAELGDSAAIPSTPDVTERLRRGAEARRTLIEGNLRLVMSIARRYRKTHLSEEDIVQEGIVGLMRAVDLWDHTRGLKFSTYATWWIRQSITRAIADKNRLIRFPVHFVEELSRFRKLRSEMRDKFEREPSAAELAAALTVPISRIALLRHPIEATSIDQELTPTSSSSSSLHDVVPDTESPMAFEEVEDRLILAAMRDALRNVLSPTEFTVLALRSGLDGSEPHTLQAIGNRFNVTRERIRQIEAKARRKAAGSRTLMTLLERPQRAEASQSAPENSKKRKRRPLRDPWDDGSSTHEGTGTSG